MTANADRFTSRVADYVRYRPDYPAAALELLRDHLPARPGCTVADIGAGTGILTAQLLALGAPVVAVEPNTHMLDAARNLLHVQPQVTFVEATAESTTLADSSVDAIAVGQAFHWFDHAACRREFTRILQPSGNVALLWNTKQFGSSAFLGAYEELLLAHAPAFADVRHETTDDAVITQFYGHEPARFKFPHAQQFDWVGVLGRVMSSSYAPQSGAPGHDALVTALHALFDEHAVDGIIDWPYTTVVYLDQLR